MKDVQPDVLGGNNLNGFEVAVLKNNFELVKKISDWAEKYQYTEGKIVKFLAIIFQQIIYYKLNFLSDNFKDAGRLITYLVAKNYLRNSMTDSIYFGYEDMIDMLIE